MASNNIGIGYRNRAETGVTITGGSWLAALPASNMLTADRADVARSTNALTTSTLVDIDLGQLRELRAFALAGHTISQAGTWRVRLGTSSGASDVWDSSGQAAWYLPFTSPEEWEAPNWWGLTQQDYMGHPYAAMIVAPRAYQARYLRISIDDTTNAIGYVQVARLWAGDLWQPALNAIQGLQHGWADLSNVDRSAAGSPLVNRRRRYRTASLQYVALSPDEAAAAAEIKRRAGIAGEVLYVPEPMDYQFTQRYGFIGRLSSTPALQWSGWRLHSTAFELEEWI